MARFMIGTGGFEYHYIVSSKSIDLALLAKASGVGLLIFAVEYLVTFDGGSHQEIPVDDLAARARLTDAKRGGLYEVTEGEDPQTAFDGVCLAEQARVPAILAAFGAEGGPSPVRIDLRGRAHFRITSAEWERMVEWINTFLTAELKLTVDAVRGFDREALERFNPDEHGEGDKATGTRHASFLYAANADRYLPYLALRILTHAVQHGLDSMTVHETDRLWRGTLWEAPPAA